MTFGDLRSRHKLDYPVSVVNRGGVSLSSSKVVPLVSLNIILRHTLTFGVHHAEVILSIRNALIARFAIQFERLGIILWNTVACGINHTEVELRCWLSLFSGLAKPFYRLRLVFCHAHAIGIRTAKNKLR